MDIPNKGAEFGGPKENLLKPRNNHLLLIGINAYENGITPLNNAVGDAMAVQEVLTQRYDFSADRVYPLFDQVASQAEVLSTLREVVDRVEENDSLLIYFSGHGWYDHRLKMGYLLPADASSRETSGYLPYSTLFAYIAAMPCLHVLMIADACYAGSAFMSRTAGIEPALERLMGLPSRWLIAAGRNEVVSDGPPGSHSPFAGALLELLKRHSGGWLPVADLTQQLIMAVGNNSDQLPRGGVIRNTGDMGGQFMFKILSETESPLPVPVERPKPKPLPEAGQPIEMPPPQPQDSKEIPETFRSVREVQRTIQALLNIGEIKAALKVFDRILKFGSSLSTDIFGLSGQYHRLEKDRQRGLLTPEYATVQQNRILYALTEYNMELKEWDLAPGVLKRG